MSIWKITYYDSPLGNTAFVKADMVRISTQSGDMWFCDEADKKYANDYLPKFILGKGSYISIERIEEEVPSKVKEVDLTEEVKEAMADKMDWI